MISPIITLAIFLVFVALGIIQIVSWSIKRKIILARKKFGVKQPFLDTKLYNLEMSGYMLSKKEKKLFSVDLKKQFLLAKKLDFIRIILCIVFALLLVLVYFSQ